MYGYSCKVCKYSYTIYGRFHELYSCRVVPQDPNFHPQTLHLLNQMLSIITSYTCQRRLERFLIGDHVIFSAWHVSLHPILTFSSTFPLYTYNHMPGYVCGSYSFISGNSSHILCDECRVYFLPPPDQKKTGGTKSRNFFWSGRTENRRGPKNS